MSFPRKLTVYERNQLLKYSLKESDLVTKGNLPVEYLTGRVTFAGLELMLDRNVLIPRVESEELVDQVVDFVTNIDQPDLASDYAERIIGFRNSRAGIVAERDFGTKHRFSSYPVEPSAAGTAISI